MKALLVFGTRPEAIKMAPLYHAMARDPEFEPVVCVTGQHRQMLDQFMAAFQMRADYDLDIMKPGQDLFDVTSAALLGLRRAIGQAKPDVLLVQGDTTTALAGAMAGFFTRIPVGHVEAGLRTYDLTAPFPEEGNRAMLSRIATFHFAPTARSRDNLLAERIPADRIWVTGNTVIDALLWMRARIADRRDWNGCFAGAEGAIASDRPLVLVTGHRRENFGTGFEAICRGIGALARRNPGVEIVYPVHLNPNVQEPVHRLLAGLPNVHLLAPLDYPPFVHLMNRAQLILTDSGGVQEEAPSLGKPVLVMRETTERPEAVEAGTVVLVGTDEAKLVAEAESLLTDPIRYQAMAQAHNPYGDGQAAGRILDALRHMKRSVSL